MKQKILVSGLINIETTLKIEGFPVNYHPVYYPFFGVHSGVSGVGYNVSKALSELGNEVDFLSLTGSDQGYDYTMSELKKDKIKPDYIYKGLKETPQSVILYDNNGRRQIHVDLKDIQETAYPAELFQEALSACSLACLCNINFSRAFLKPARDSGKITASDVHVLTDAYDPYNSDFMKGSDILFLSNEGCMGHEIEMAQKLQSLYHNKIIVVGMGGSGALLLVKEDDYTGVFPAVKTREIINTIGAGDAMFSAFIHIYLKSKDPYLSLKKAIVFASYKIGEKGAAEGFLNNSELDNWTDKIYQEG